MSERLLKYGVKDAVASVLGGGQRITEITGVSGGDINRAYRLTASDGTRLFMKCNAKANLPFFLAETEGLEAIASAGAIRTPAVLGTGTDERYGAFLLLEWIEAAPRKQDYWESFGRRLAALHAWDTSSLIGNGIFGFPHDNFIGAGDQINTPRESWIEFFRDCRLAPMLARADGYLDASDKKNAEQLLDHLDKYLEEPTQPSLLHGDLWCGNFTTGSDGEVWLIDPAAYVGHCEADLAMTELFGGYPAAFYDAYKETRPLQPGYERRRDIYNLYHLLNHLNLFGDSYLDAVRQILRAYR